MFFDSINNSYVLAFLLFFVLFLVFRVGFFLLEKILLNLTLKTKTDLDDIILKKSSLPVNILMLFLSLRITLNQLDFNVADSIILVVNRLILSVIVLTVGYFLYMISDLLIGRAFRKFARKTESKLDDSLLSLVHSVLKIALIVVIALYLLGVWGVEILPLLGALGVAGIAIALALQPVLSNIFSGASMILDKSIEKGDLVYLDAQTKGKILKVGMRSTRMLTFDNELVIVPNTKLAESIIQNVALPEPKTRVVVPFGVAYGSDVDKVKKIIIKEMEHIHGILLDNDHKPVVRFLEMAESSLNFKAYFYVPSFENRASALDEANTRIYNILRKNKIEIPFPQMDVHLKK